MASNIRPRNPSKESPTEPFKRAVTGCLRAIARKPELEVAFAAERPGIVGGKARLPEPPRKLGGVDAAIVRGHADSIALKLARELRDLDQSFECVLTTTTTTGYAIAERDR